MKQQNPAMFNKLSLMDAINSLSNRSESFLKTTTVTFVILLGFIDQLTGYEYSFSLFYLAPISAASWLVGRRWGLTISLLSAVTWLIADISSGDVLSSPFINVWNSLIRLGFFVIVTLLMTSLRQSFEREQDLARSDRTTGAANSRHFYELAQIELDRTRRSGHHFTIAYVDLDNFKYVNDHFGHAQGDEVLKLVATTAQSHLRTSDMFARLGGDEFAILLADTGQIGAQAAIPKIRLDLLEKMKDQNWPVTFSIGVVTFTKPPATVDDMLHAADELMYSVKTNNKNNVRYETRDG